MVSVEGIDVRKLQILTMIGLLIVGSSGSSRAKTDSTGMRVNLLPKASWDSVRTGPA